MNVIARLDLERAYYDSAVHRFNHYTTRTLPRTFIDKIKENAFKLTKERSRRNPAKTITDADYADDMAILANTPNQAETLLYSLERDASDIGLHVNAHKTEYMCFNQTGDISTQNGSSVKLVDKCLINRDIDWHATSEVMDSSGSLSVI